MANTYKCPGCGAPLEYTPGTDALVCEYCSTKVRVEDLRQMESYEYRVENHIDQNQQERQNFNSYTCQSCGAQLIVDDNMTATVCCYCGSSALLRERLEGVLKPAGVIPFKIDREQAKERFRKWLCTGIFTPSVFKKTAALENVRGIYVPFWLYDYKADAKIAAECTKVHRERRGNTEYIHTDYFMIEREGTGIYEKVPVDASEKMPDDMMDMMEPYNYSEMREFEMPYLSGYQSEKYNYESNDSQMAERVENRVSAYIFQDIKDTISGYTTTRFLKNDVSLYRKKAVYTLLPVWMITYRYKGENKSFAINGQTGKQVGELPNSFGKITAWFGGITVGIALILLVMGGLFG